jgi:hypothetical protein
LPIVSGARISEVSLDQGIKPNPIEVVWIATAALEALLRIALPPLKLALHERYLWVVRCRDPAARRRKRVEKVDLRGLDERNH